MSHEYLVLQIESGSYRVGTNGDTYNNGLSKLVENVVIPNFWNKIPITIIGQHAIKTNSVIKSLSIPSNILIIRFDAISHNPNLSSITFAKNSSLKEVGRGFIYNCPLIKKLILPSSLTTVGIYFIGQSSVDDIYYCGFSQFTETTMFQNDAGTPTHPKRVHVPSNYGYTSMGKLTNLLRDYKCERYIYRISNNKRCYSIRFSPILILLIIS